MPEYESLIPNVYFLDGHPNVTDIKYTDSLMAPVLEHLASSAAVFQSPRRPRWRVGRDVPYFPIALPGQRETHRAFYAYKNYVGRIRPSAIQAMRVAVELDVKIGTLVKITHKEPNGKRPTLFLVNGLTRYSLVAWGNIERRHGLDTIHLF